MKKIKKRTESESMSTIYFRRPTDKRALLTDKRTACLLVCVFDCLSLGVADLCDCLFDCVFA